MKLTQLAFHAVLLQPVTKLRVVFSTVTPCSLVQIYQFQTDLPPVFLRWSMEKEVPAESW
jgi:hypothetical protein